MKRVSYCGESFLTTDQAADALLQLVAALDDHHDSELVELPAVQSDGKTVTVHMIVGPRSELVSIPEDGQGDEPDTTDAVVHLRDRARIVSAAPEEHFVGACAPVECGWDDIYAL